MGFYNSRKKFIKPAGENFNKIGQRSGHFKLEGVSNDFTVFADEVDNDAASGIQVMDLDIHFLTIKESIHIFLPWCHVTCCFELDFIVVVFWARNGFSKNLKLKWSKIKVFNLQKSIF